MSASTSPAIHETPRVFGRPRKSDLGLPLVYLVVMIAAAVWAVVLTKTAGVLALRGRLRSNRVSVAVMLVGLGVAVLWALLALPVG